MSNWPDWFLEALRQRYYQLDLDSEQFKMNQNGDIQQLLSEWREAISYQLSQDKQSIYMEGVKDVFD